LMSLWGVDRYDELLEHDGLRIVKPPVARVAPVLEWTGQSRFLRQYPSPAPLERDRMIPPVATAESTDSLPATDVYVLYD
jgi:hypothetical protein